MKAIGKSSVLLLALAACFLVADDNASAQCLPGYYCGPRTNAYRGVPVGQPSNIIRSRPVMGPMPVTTQMYRPVRRCYSSGAVDRFGNPYTICY
jgi:hypothetical protein